jgi:hypothetical protein
VWLHGNHKVTKSRYVSAFGKAIAMTQVDDFDPAEPDRRWAVESFNPRKEMSKMHYEAPRLDRSWTAPRDEMAEAPVILATAT